MAQSFYRPDGQPKKIMDRPNCTSCGAVSEVVTRYR